MRPSDPWVSNLESEAIEILREGVATAARPVMLYSIGKDSSVLLHLARKAFWPAPPPMPLLHVDTTWKFHDMIAFRDRVASSSSTPTGRAWTRVSLRSLTAPTNTPTS